jgi:Lrp/AsnC family transcriptional regulator, leucine-responsive regulatory protein
MATIDLDEVDRMLLRTLTRNSRVSASALAQIVGLTRQAVADRMVRLRKEGVIRNFTISLDADKLGLDVRALVAITLLPACTEKSEQGVILLLRRSPWVRECYRVTGEDYFQVRVVAPDISALKDLVMDLRNTGVVQGTRTMLALETNFEKSSLESFDAFNRMWNGPEEPLTNTMASDLTSGVLEEQDDLV